MLVSTGVSLLDTSLNTRVASSLSVLLSIVIINSEGIINTNRLKNILSNETREWPPSYSYAAQSILEI
jgi:hypothetical protein